MLRTHIFFKIEGCLQTPVCAGLVFCPSAVVVNDGPHDFWLGIDKSLPPLLFHLLLCVVDATVPIQHDYQWSIHEFRKKMIFIEFWIENFVLIVKNGLLKNDV